MIKKLPLNIPDESGHLLEVDQTTGHEFLLGGESLLNNADFWVKYSREDQLKYLYNQLEFEADFGRCMCTAY